jgi:hypothetical protein
VHLLEFSLRKINPFGHATIAYVVSYGKAIKKKRRGVSWEIMVKSILS